MQKKILVIDDEELLTRTFARLLEKNNYQVLLASSGEDGCAMAEEEKFDLIICDMRMPGINGVKTIKSIYEICRKNSNVLIPVIFITGYADERLEQEAKTLEPVAYMDKPFDIARLLNLVKKTLEENE